MSLLRWWEIETAEKWAEFEQRLLKFEDSVFLGFSTNPPSKEMSLINRMTWIGEEWIFSQCDIYNDDQQEAIRLLKWHPWPQVIGYRTTHIGDILRIILSVDALRYYAPAFMLHWLYFRYEPMRAGEEIEELFIPPDDELICKTFSGYGLRNNRHYDGFYIDRFYWFRDGMTIEQRRVCREFCSLWVPWRYRDKDFSIVEESYVRLLGYWV